MKAFIKKILGSQHAREVKKLQPIVEEINQAVEDLTSLSDDELKEKTEEFKARGSRTGLGSWRRESRPSATRSGAPRIRITAWR